ncbi:MAG: hypothetical protein LBU65_08115, partial [Planctomycetaceae bacterium]|nr:hypothetical protein [Planctomycetaceae bacterium]
MFTAKSEMDLRLQVKDKFFSQYKVSLEDKRIDFLVYSPTSLFTSETLLWAESKKDITPVNTMFAQLLLTIKKTVDSGEMPPKFLGVFDKEKIAFVEYHHILPVFNLNDFNWNEKPSTVSKKTENTVGKFLTKEVLNQFEFKKDEAELREFIKTNFIIGNVSLYKAQINKNNFVTVYNKWIDAVKPTIAVDFNELKKAGVLDADFFLADLLSKNNKSLYQTLKIVLRESEYHINVDKIKHLLQAVFFKGNQQKHTEFWTKYKRPPAEEYWQYMLERRDLLVPQQIREQKGAYFTPQIWVEKSQEYLEKAFGENWQDEYYIWDCCCGTGNLLAGLVNPDNVWASTIDQPDVDIVHQMIGEGFNLLKPHVFQFDFLGDEFLPQSKGGKIPDLLFRIVNNSEKQKKLIIYMNPPYAETGDGLGTQTNKKFGFSQFDTHFKYKDDLGKASHEFFSQFFFHILKMMPNTNLASFSTLKYVNSINFQKFRKSFRAKYKAGFMCRAETFDNVQGMFPIGFLIWGLSQSRFPKSISVDILNDEGIKIEKKRFYNNKKYINEWMNLFSATGHPLGFLYAKGMDFQNNQGLWISIEQKKSGGSKFILSESNWIVGCIYFAVRHVFKHTWINHNDQFLFPNDGYKKDRRFQNDCLTFALFHEKNKISSQDGINHWIPFTRKDVKGKDSFMSMFMSDFLQTRGRFSKESNAVFEAGKALWAYYHQTIKDDNDAAVDASLYDIREYFKGRNEKGKMKARSTDERFNELDKA